MLMCSAPEAAPTPPSGVLCMDNSSRPEHHPNQDGNSPPERARSAEERGRAQGTNGGEGSQVGHGGSQGNGQGNREDDGGSNRNNASAEAAVLGVQVSELEPMIQMLRFLHDAHRRGVLVDAHFTHSVREVIQDVKDILYVSDGSAAHAATGAQRIAQLMQVVQHLPPELVQHLQSLYHGPPRP